MKPILAIIVLALFSVGCLPILLEDTNPIIYDIAWSPLTNDLVVSGYELQLYTENLQQVTTLDAGRDNSQILAWHPDGRTLVEAGCEIALWDINLHQVITTIDGYKCLNDLAWNPDGTLLATSGSDETIRIMNSDSLNLVETLKHHSDSLPTILWDSDGNILESGSFDESIGIWNVKTGEILWTQDFSATVFSVELSPNVKLVAVASWDNDVQIWNIATGQLDKSLGAYKDAISAHIVDWNPTGTQIATASLGLIQIWELATGEISMSISTDGARVDSIAWNSDGSMLASASRDNQLRVWNIETGELQFESQLPHR